MLKGSQWLRCAARFVPAAPLRPFGRPVALFFHGVAERIVDPRIEINHHTLSGFRAIARQLKRDFRVLPLSDLDDALARPEQHRRTVFLMSDDGYANTLLAADVLAECELPWTLFASTEHIETDDLNPLTLARLFAFHAAEGRYPIAHVGETILPENPEGRARIAARLVAVLKALPEPCARAAVASLRSAFSDGAFADLRSRFASERYLNWGELEALHRRGVEIGAHAHWHWPMNASQPLHHIAEQASRPRALIEKKLGRCRYFAYPFGNAGDVSREARQAVRRAGYSHAFTTLSGTLGPHADPFLLPRYGLRPREGHLPALLPLIRAGNSRVAHLQRQLVS
jgi:peptidoglycan/xylan/chitin deacetylase (PgdA/CDA1 family)